MKRKIYFVFLALLGGISGHGQIAAWDFYGQSFPVTCAATTFHTNLVSTGGASDITRGPGAAASGGVHSFRTTGFQNNGIALTNSDYFQVTLQAAPGFRVSLSTLDAKFNGTSTFFTSPGVTSQFAYSIDGATFTLIGNPVQSTSLTMAQIDLTGIPDLQHVYNGTTITLRYYASGQTSTGGWGFYSAAAGTNGLAVGGMVDPAVITVPSLQASAIIFSNVQQTQMSMSWIPGNGEKRIVKINTMNSFTDPVNGTDPQANPVYGGSGEQVIYNYSGASIPVVTGLTMGITYWFRVYEYNGSGSLTMYNSMATAGNPGSQTTSVILLTPVIASPVRSSVTDHGAILGGRIISHGGSPVTGRGTVWSSTGMVTVNDHKLPEGGADTGFFSHPRDTLPPAMLIHFAAYATNATGTALTPEATFYTLDIGPPGHVTSFQATANGTTSVILSWNPLPSGADGYLIVQKAGVLPAAGLPTDTVRYEPGNLLGDGVVAADIIDGTAGTTTIGGLSPGTAYAFSIFPYAWDGVHPQTTHYYAGSPAPWDSALTALPGAITYHWTGVSGTDWTVAGNWNPQRNIPAPNDILVFDIGGIWTIVNVPAQTIGQIKVHSYTGITLQGSGTLTVAGDSGEDLEVSFGSHLNLAGTTALTISLAPGATGSISGEMTFSGGGHRLLAASSNGAVFNAGSQFKAGSGFSGNPFGTANLNSVVFTSGSTYVCQGGGNPFGATAPASVVVFQPGSLYRLDAYVVPSFGGRTYGNFEMNFAGSITVTGSSAVTIGNFTASQGTFCFNMTGNPGHSIRGNIFISSLATLIFTPASAGTVMLNGASPQAIHGFGSLMAGTNSTLVCSNIAGVTLSMNATLYNLTITGGGMFTIAPGAGLTVNGNLVNGNPATGLILEPDGSLIQQSSGVAGLVKRSMAAADWSDWQDGWHFLSSPVASQPINAGGGFITSGNGNDYDFYAWTEPDNRWINIKNTTIAPLFSNVNSGNDFLTGKGYLTAYQQTGIKTFSGMLNAADVPVANLTRTGDTAAYRGWNLLGNPFPCSITWYTGWNAINIGGVAQIWNEAGMSYTPRNAGEPIPACNGFMVQVTGSAGATGSLTIPASRRIHSSLAWFKEESMPVIRLIARNAGGQAFQESQVRFNPLASFNFDAEYDGRFLPGYAPHFYSVCGREKLSVNSIPSSPEEMPIPFHFIKNKGDRFVIEAIYCGEVPSMVLLVDQQEGISQDMIAKPVYAFNAGDHDPPDRFVLRVRLAGKDPENGAKTAVIVRGGNLLVKFEAETRLELFDIAGRSLLVKEFAGQGQVTVPLHVPSGIYLIRTISGGFTRVTKVYIHLPL